MKNGVRNAIRELGLDLCDVQVSHLESVKSSVLKSLKSMFAVDILKIQNRMRGSIDSFRINRNKTNV